MKVIHTPCVVVSSDELQDFVMKATKKVGIDLRGFYFTTSETIEVEIDKFDFSDEFVYDADEWVSLMKEAEQPTEDFVFEIIAQYLQSNTQLKEVLKDAETIQVRVTKPLVAYSFTGTKSTLLN